MRITKKHLMNPFKTVVFISDLRTKLLAPMCCGKSMMYVEILLSKRFDGFKEFKEKSDDGFFCEICGRMRDTKEYVADKVRESWLNTP